MKADCIIRTRDHSVLYHTLCDVSAECRTIVVSDSSFGLECGEQPDYYNREHVGDVHVHWPEHRGAVSATNAGLAMSLQFTDTDWVIVLDDDVRFPAGDRDWLDRWLAEAAEHDDTGAIGATSNRVAGMQQILHAPVTYMRNWKSGVKNNPPVPVFVSAAVMLRKAAVRQCGLWDTRYDPGQYEDTDYSLTLREAGWQIRVARSVYVEHQCHQTFGDQTPKLMEANQAKFIAKWNPGRLWDLGILSDQDIAAFCKARGR